MHLFVRLHLALCTQSQFQICSNQNSRGTVVIKRTSQCSVERCPYPLACWPSAAQSIMPVCMTECSGTGDFLTLLPLGDLAGGVRAFISFCTQCRTISSVCMARVLNAAHASALAASHPSSIAQRAVRLFQHDASLGLRSAQPQQA